MKLPFVTRRCHEAELAAVRSYCDALRERCAKAEQRAATETVARRTITRQHADLDATNRRLEGRNLELGRRISQLAEADPEYTAALDRRVTRLRTVGARLLAAYAAELRRANRLQRQLDDVFGLNGAQVAAGATWRDRREKPRWDK